MIKRAKTADVVVCAEAFASSVETCLRLVFTSDGVVVGVINRNVKRHDLVKIKPTENTNSVYVSVFGVGRQKRKNKPMTMLDYGLCDWLVLPLLLSTPTI